MGALTDLLKEIPLSAVLREKVKTLESQHAEKVKTLESERDKFKAEVQNLGRLNKMLENENRELAAKLDGVGKFHKGVRFRRNIATGHKWMPFCPVCDTLLQISPPPYSHIGLHCSRQGCGFRHSSFPSSELDKVIAELGN